MMIKKISPSMMCADMATLEKTLKIFKVQGIEYLHIDVMDGSFVPNFTLGTDYIKNIRKLTDIPLDIHLMIEDPENKLDFFEIREGDFVSVHAETTRHLQKVLAKIREKGGRPMVALNPATPIYILENVLDDIDGVLIMSVNPGFAGQKLIPVALKKLRALRQWLDDLGYDRIEIEVDGNVSFENAESMAVAGANIFVVGTSSVFSENTTLADGIKRFRAIVNGEEYAEEGVLSELEKYNKFSCACGRLHTFGTRVYIGEGELSRIAERVKELGAEKLYLVADKNTYRVAGKRAEELITSAGTEVVSYIFKEERPVPDEKSVGLAFMHKPADCDAVLGVGSGVINDICKIVAATADLPYIILATAPSMDGYASATSSMERDGLKISLNSKAPDTVIGDLDILASAPERMLSSGIGDMLAKYVAICEWRIAHIITGEYYCEEIASLMRGALKNCVDVAEAFAKGEKLAVKRVFEGLIISGAAAEYAGVSRPASGVEHYISHVFDMRGVSFGTKTDTHGIQCAIATLVAVELYEKLKNMTPVRERAEAYVKSFDYAAHAKALREFVGSGADSMIALEKKEGKYDPATHPERFERIADNWQEILRIINEELPSSDEIRKLLKIINIPESFSDVGIDDSLVPSAFRFTKDIRDKYVLSRLFWDLGIDSDTLF